MRYTSQIASKGCFGTEVAICRLNFHVKHRGRQMVGTSDPTGHVHKCAV